MKAHVVTRTLKGGEHTMFIGLVFLIVILVALYAYFVSISVVHILTRTEAENNTAIISSEIGELESLYIEHQALINREHAYSLGFHKVTEKQFVARNPGLGTSLTVNQ